MPLSSEEREMLIRIDNRTLETRDSSARVEGQVMTLSSRLNAHIGDDRSHPKDQIRAVTRDHRETRKKLDSLTDEVAGTGRHEVVELRDNQKWTLRTFVTAGITVVLGVISVLTAYAVGRGH